MQEVLHINLQRVTRFLFLLITALAQHRAQAVSTLLVLVTSRRRKKGDAGTGQRCARCPTHAPSPPPLLRPDSPSAAASRACGCEFMARVGKPRDTRRTLGNPRDIRNTFLGIPGGNIFSEIPGTGTQGYAVRPAAYCRK